MKASPRRPRAWLAARFARPDRAGTGMADQFSCDSTATRLRTGSGRSASHLRRAIESAARNTLPVTLCQCEHRPSPPVPYTVFSPVPAGAPEVTARWDERGDARAPSLTARFHATDREASWHRQATAAVGRRRPPPDRQLNSSPPRQYGAGQPRPEGAPSGFHVPRLDSTLVTGAEADGDVRPDQRRLPRHRRRRARGLRPQQPRQRLLDDTVLLADVIGNNSTAALAFGDAQAATETLRRGGDQPPRRVARRSCRPTAASSRTTSVRARRRSPPLIDTHHRDDASRRGTLSPPASSR